MENNQQIHTEKLVILQVKHGIENNQFKLLENLGVVGILKEAIKMPYNYPKFVILTFLTSLPLFMAMVFHESILQTSMIETKALLKHLRHGYYGTFLFSYFLYGRHYIDFYSMELETPIILLKNILPRLLQLGFLYLVPLHLLDLLNTVVTVTAASTIYAGRSVRLGEMLLVLKTSLVGPLITSIYVLLLNSFILFGLIWAITNSMFLTMGNFFTIIYGGAAVMIIVKWIEWSAVFNVGIVVSILEENHGLDALGASGYLSRRCRKQGLQLMLVFFIWGIILRLPCLYLGGQEKWVRLVAASFLSCAGNVMKWVVCAVYFYQCKRLTMEKKNAAENSRVNKHINPRPEECNDV